MEARRYRLILDLLDRCSLLWCGSCSGLRWHLFLVAILQVILDNLLRISLHHNTVWFYRTVRENLLLRLLYDASFFSRLRRLYSRVCIMVSNFILFFFLNLIIYGFSNLLILFLRLKGTALCYFVLLHNYSSSSSISLFDFLFTIVLVMSL